MSIHKYTAWYLKSEDGSQGPFHPEDLIQMACVGSLLGDNEVSANAEGPWLKAEALSALELDWQVHPEEGDPLPRCHVMALRNWVENETIQPYWDVIHIPTGENYDVVDALCSALLAQNHLLEERIVSLLNENDDEISPVAEDANPQDIRVALDRSKKEATKWKRLYDDEIARNEHREQDLLHDNEELRAWQRKAAERIKALERRQVTIEESRVDTEILSKISGDKDLSRAYHELHLQMNNLLESLELKSRQLDESRAQVNDLKLQVRTERNKAEERVEKVSQLHEDTLDQLNRMEQGHIHLTRSFRDLNDRLIRLRNSIDRDPEASTPAAPTQAPVKPAPQKIAKSAPKADDKNVKIKMT
ncbi:hypothetical protein P3T73_15740 [Kiritimatiellota bacterium B12222]|nr:hypothetical protein P3T73_15740 [Kiritimatiellota bacterium B12222]